MAKIVHAVLLKTLYEHQLNLILDTLSFFASLQAFSHDVVKQTRSAEAVCLPLSFKVHNIFNNSQGNYQFCRFFSFFFLSVIAGADGTTSGDRWQLITSLTFGDCIAVVWLYWGINGRKSERPGGAVSLWVSLALSVCCLQVLPVPEQVFCRCSGVFTQSKDMYDKLIDDSKSAPVAVSLCDLDWRPVQGVPAFLSCISHQIF